MYTRFSSKIVSSAFPAMSNYDKFSAPLVSFFDQNNNLKIWDLCRLCMTKNTVIDDTAMANRNKTQTIEVVHLQISKMGLYHHWSPNDGFMDDELRAMTLIYHNFLLSPNYTTPMVDGLMFPTKNALKAKRVFNTYQKEVPHGFSNFAHSPHIAVQVKDNSSKTSQRHFKKVNGLTVGAYLQRSKGIQAFIVGTTAGTISSMKMFRNWTTSHKFFAITGSTLLKWLSCPSFLDAFYAQIQSIVLS